MQGENPVITIRHAAATAKINVTKLRGNVSVLEGSGGNITALTGRDGKVLVDAGITASRPQITKPLASLIDDPVKHLINSHWHFDHTDGNEWLHSAGARIIAQENTRKHLSGIQRVEDWDYTMGVLLRGVFLGMKHGARLMKAQGQGGTIISTASGTRSRHSSRSTGTTRSFSKPPGWDRPRTWLTTRRSCRR